MTQAETDVPSSFIFTVTLDNDVQDGVDVTYDINDLTTTSGADYTDASAVLALAVLARLKPSP